MPPQVIVASLALALSIISLLLTLGLYKKQAQLTALQKNIEALSKVESLVAEHPELLRLHGIDPAELERIGITSVDFAYLVANFSAGALFHDVPGRRNDTTPLGPETYRGRMLGCEITRRAWPLVKNFLDPGAFVARVDRTVKDIEAEEEQKRADSMRSASA